MSKKDWVKPNKDAEAPETETVVPAVWTLGSLFDGIGGFPLVAVRNDIRPVWASEIEAFPIAVTQRHFPDMRHVGDVTRLDGAQLPPVDIVCGGSPCQDLSVAGTRSGLAGARSGLFLQQIRIVKEMRNADIARGRTDKLVRPRIFLWENVHDAYVTVSVRSRSCTRIFRLAAKNSSTCMVK